MNNSCSGFICPFGPRFEDSGVTESSFLVFDPQQFIWLTAGPKNSKKILKVIYSPYVNKAFVYIFASKILSFIRQLFIFSSF
jgi:hypothetical protein